MSRIEQIARRRAGGSDHSLHHHAAIIIRKGRMLSAACNLGWIHAECRALKAASRRSLVGAIVYSFRFGKDGKMRLAKPCANCQTAMEMAGIKRCYYSTTDGGIAVMEL